MMRRGKLSLIVAVGLVIALVLNFMVGAAGASPNNGDEAVEAKEVRGVVVRPGVKLWVFVFPAHPDRPGSSTNICVDGDQDAYKLLDFLPNPGLEFNINAGSIPDGVDTTEATALEAIHDSFSAWEGASATDPTLFTVNDSGGASRPAEDGNNTVGWVRIVPPKVLAACWIWTDEDNVVKDADIFYNTDHPWAAFTSCLYEDKYEVGNIGTHELGHVVSLDHVKDAGQYATMYPSAPSGETRKRTLTDGEIAGLAAALGQEPTPPPPPGDMHVDAIDMWYSTAGPNYFVNTKVTIVDADGVAVPEATVYLETTLDGTSVFTGSATTNGEGIATFKLRSRQAGNYISNVTNVAKDAWTYDIATSLEYEDDSDSDGNPDEQIPVS